MGLVAALTLGSAGCQRADVQASATDATALTVYSSLPLQGTAGPESRAVANGQRLALREARGKVGDLVIKLAVLDDSTPRAGRWDPEQTADNARVAVRDRTTIAYLGDGNSGATAISLPILNGGGVAQVSPTSTHTGLTRAQGAGKGEPEKYYPAQTRAFVRPVPADHVQAAAMLAGLRDESCRRLYLFDDGDLEGLGLAEAVQRAAGTASIATVARKGLRPDVDVIEAAADVVTREADCVLVAGTLFGRLASVMNRLHAADARLELFASAGPAPAALAAGLNTPTQPRVHLTAPPGILEPSPGVRSFARRYREVFGKEARSGALYGYEAMRLVLAAVRKAGPEGNDRAAVGRALFTLGERSSPLGSYRIDPAGDTTSTAYSQLGVRDGRIVRRGTASYAAG